MSDAPKKRRLLIVEDDWITLDLMQVIFQEMDLEVFTAGTVEAAKQIADTHGLDLVITDIGLPDGSGAELMQELHRKFGLKGIAMTGRDEPNELGEGFVSHVTKPVDWDSLQGMVRSMLPKE